MFNKFSNFFLSLHYNNEICLKLCIHVLTIISQGERPQLSIGCACDVSDGVAKAWHEVFMLGVVLPLDQGAFMPTAE